MLGWLRRLGGDRRACAACGLNVKRIRTGARVRYGVDADQWSARCKAAGESVRGPFECPHLRKAMEKGKQRG